MTHPTQIDFSTLSAYQRYKLMASLIVPRPIALVTTRSADGVVNAAPFSMFNMLGEDPPILMISINKLQDETPQGHRGQHPGQRRVRGAHRRRADGRADAPLRRPPAGHAQRTRRRGLDHGALPRRKPPRIVEAPVAFECRLSEKLETASRHIFIGEVLWLHAREDLIDTGALPGASCRTTFRWRASAPASTCARATASRWRRPARSTPSTR